MAGTRSTGSRSIVFIRTIQRNTVSASGETNLRLLALCTMPLACESTISTRISTAAWKRPGTPAVALRAAFQRKKQAITPSTIAQNIESQLKTEKSTTLPGFLFCRNVRWWTMYSPAVGACSAACSTACSAAMFRFVFSVIRRGTLARCERQRHPVHLHREHQPHQQGRPAQLAHQPWRGHHHGHRQGDLDHLPHEEPEGRRAGV